MELADSILTFKGVGDELARKLAIVGIRSINDLITNYPRRYEDYSNIINISDMRPGTVTLEAEISHVTGRYVRRGMHITEAIASDESGSVRLVWFNQSYRAASIKAGQKYFISGEYALRSGRFSIASPSIELVGDFPINTARIIPIYRETKGLKSYVIRRLLKTALGQLKQLPEHLPEWLIKDQKLMSFESAVREMHFPSSAEKLENAKRRLGFEEVFQLTLAALLNKYELMQEIAIAIPFKQQLAKQFVSSLPFDLTNAQRKVIWQIYLDIAKTQPMNRLVEGDVGAGKTVVAVMAALMAMEQNFQVALMAPTEILARQHGESIYNLLKSVGFENQVGLLIGALKPAQKNLVREKISKGEVRFIIGTQTLIAERVDMQKLGLIVIDEQHRFGVEQRKLLQAKAHHMPHVLHLSATPIPRSLALTLFGELDISVLDELPIGRKQVITKIVSPNSKAQLYKSIEAELESGRQMFVVCPLIVENESLAAASAEKVYDTLSKRDFKHRRVGLLHGKMKPKDKELVMQSFKNHEIDILVSTTVIEVGLDIPNASIMLIEGVNRYGLAQIHQLRGRVGRGEYQSYCFLMLEDSRAPSKRIRALETISDGFELAELDLQLRGPGAIYGTMQHGELDLRVAKLSDVKLISAARSAAQMFIDKNEILLDFPHLASRVSALRAVTNLN